ncbi:MAG: DUF4126 domain-containing protein [Planctomycetota bacterium]
MDTLIAVLIGLGLAASCGFRVFVPMLVAAVAARLGYLSTSEGFAWLSSDAAILAFSLATLLEIAAYYIPWLDNLLDTIASPVAVIAGILLFAATVGEIDPLLRWSLAVVAGGGAAAVVQGGTVLTRAASSATTGGLANFVVTTVETVAGFLFSALSIVVPVVAVVLLIAITVRMYYFGRGVLQRILQRSKT